MTVPLTLLEQMQRNWFEPDQKIAVIFGMSKFDQVYKRTHAGEYVQAFEDLATVR